MVQRHYARRCAQEIVVEVLNARLTKNSPLVDAIAARIQETIERVQKDHPQKTAVDFGACWDCGRFNCGGHY